MKQTEGNTMIADAIQVGGSDYLLLSEDIKEYLNFDATKHVLILKFDKGKWGRFVGVGIKKKE